MQCRYEASEAGVVAAIDAYDAPAIFNWLMNLFSYQGISDEVAGDFMRRQGNFTGGTVDRTSKGNCLCPKLTGYWTFSRCQYQNSHSLAVSPIIFRPVPYPAIICATVGSIKRHIVCFYLFGIPPAETSSIEKATNLSAELSRLFSLMKPYNRQHVALDHFQCRKIFPAGEPGS